MKTEDFRNILPAPVQNASHRIVTHFTHLAFLADHPGLLQQNSVPTEWRACLSRASYLIMVPFCGYFLSRRYDRLLLSQPFRQSIWQVSWEGGIQAISDFPFSTGVLGRKGEKECVGCEKKWLQVKAGAEWELLFFSCSQDEGYG